jgi:hypothetical protein
VARACFEGRTVQPRRRPALALTAGALWLAQAPPARAEAPAPDARLPLVAMRSESAQSCPDSTALETRVRSLRPEAAPEGLQVDVRFDREGPGYVATLQTGGRLQATRVLRAPGPGCEGLADATAVSISLLFDLPPPEPPPPPPPPLPANTPPAKAPPEPRPASWDARLALGGGVSWQLPSRAGGFATAEALVAPVPSLVFGLGGALGPATSVEKGEGKVDVDLRFAFARGCWVWGSVSGFRAGFCAMPAVGRLRGRGQGYEVDRESNRAWYALGGGVLASGPLVGPLGWLAQGTALAPLGRESFSVDALGQAYRTPPLGLLTSAALTVRIR